VISLEECEKAFKQIWDATLEAKKHAEEAGEKMEQIPLDDSKVQIEDFYSIIELSGKLLKKKEPSGTDTRPYDEYCGFV
jgi:hypothetical protein